MTNREWLNSLSDEEFIDMCCWKAPCGICVHTYKTCVVGHCNDGIKDWLKSEHKENENE